MRMFKKCAALVVICIVSDCGNMELYGVCYHGIQMCDNVATA